MPVDVFLVGKDRGSQSRTVVTAPANEHETSMRLYQHLLARLSRGEANAPGLGNFASGLELIIDLFGLNVVHAVIDSDFSVGVLVRGSDEVLGVSHVRCVDADEIGRASCSGRVHDRNGVRAVDGSSGRALCRNENRSLGRVCAERRCHFLRNIESFL